MIFSNFRIFFQDFLPDKYSLYERVDVKEYWVIDPSNKTLSAYILNEQENYARVVVYAGEDVLKTMLFEGLDIRIEDV